MKRILANDGISEAGIFLLKNAGFEVIKVHVAENQLGAFINNEKVSILIVRSATQVTRKLIDACPGLEIIARIGSGMDNIDVDFARAQGLEVLNTPGSGSQSVAELVFAHLLGGSRFLHDSNRNMPLEGDQHFKVLKKTYAEGKEICGKTLGIIGMGNIGLAVAKIGIGLGMEILYHDPFRKEIQIPLSFQSGAHSFELSFTSIDLDNLLAESDFVTLHLPAQKNYLIGKREIGLMKPGSAIINTARGGLVDEVALVDALESGHLSFAALDVFESEPHPEIQLLMRPELSLTPHIGGSTPEAQERAAEAIAHRIIAFYNSKNELN